MERRGLSHEARRLARALDDTLNEMGPAARAQIAGDARVLRASRHAVDAIVDYSCDPSPARRDVAERAAFGCVAIAVSLAARRGVEISGALTRWTSGGDSHAQSRFKIWGA